MGAIKKIDEPTDWIGSILLEKLKINLAEMEKWAP